MRKIRTIIVDDEPLALKGLALRLKAFDDIDMVRQCRNGREAVQAVREEQPDLLLLDIEMPGLDGLGVVKSLIGGPLPLVVFVTAYNEYALKAFETHALDYLLKPVDEDRLSEALDKVRERLGERAAIEQNAKILALLEGMDDPPQQLLSAVLDAERETGHKKYDNVISIKDRGVITRVPVSDISHIDAAGDYMCIYTPEKTHILRATMKALEKRLDPEIFQRIHRSTIVNLDKVKEVHPHNNGEYYLLLENGKELKVSRSYKDVISRFL